MEKSGRFLAITTDFRSCQQSHWAERLRDGVTRYNLACAVIATLRRTFWPIRALFDRGHSSLRLAGLRQL
jgi:hypothetical protein